MQTNKTLIFDKNAAPIFKKGNYTDSYMVINLKSINLTLDKEERNGVYYYTATLTDDNNNPIPNNIIKFYHFHNNDEEFITQLLTDENGQAILRYNYDINIIIKSGDVTLTDNVKKTPAFLILSIDTNTLSAKHNEIATLTAVVKDNDNNVLSGQDVVFKKGANVLDTITTNDNGVATYTYTATGDNEVVIIAECGILTQSVTIHDYLLYDDGNVDKSSSYGIYIANSGGYATFTHDNINNWYDFTVDTVKDKFKIMQFGEFTDNDLIYELDIFIANKTSPFNCIANIRDVNTVVDGNSNGLQLGTWTSQRFVRFMKNNTNMGTDSPSGALSTGVNYTLIASMNNSNNTLTATIFNKDTDTILLTKTWNNTASTNDKWYATFGQYGYNATTTTRIKRIMVKKI